MTGRSSPMLPTVEYVFEDGSDSASQVPSAGRHRLSVTSTASARSSRGAVEAAMSLISTTAELSRTRSPRAIEAEAECSDHVRHVPMGPNPPPTEDLAQYPTEASSTAPVQAARVGISPDTGSEPWPRVIGSPAGAVGFGTHW